MLLLYVVPQFTLHTAKTSNGTVPTPALLKIRKHVLRQHLYYCMLHQCTIPGFELWIAAMNLFFFLWQGIQHHKVAEGDLVCVTKKLDLAKEKNAECRTWQLQEGQVAFFCIMMVEGFCVGYEGVRNKTSAKMWCRAVPSPHGIGMSNTIQRNMENILSRKPKCRKDNSQVHTCKNQPWTIITSRSQAIQCSCGVIAGHSPPLPNFFC